MLAPQSVILILKIAVVSVTVLLLTSLVAIYRGQQRLHGRINLVFFTLTLAAVLGLELQIHVLNPGLFDDYIRKDPVLYRALNIHLCFSVPSALIMPVMLYTGLTHRRTAHLLLACVFGILWTGTFVTGIFFLPHR